ncbi:MAG: ABC transporter substrate-binding protein [Devosia sp.]
MSPSTPSRPGPSRGRTRRAVLARLLATTAALTLGAQFTTSFTAAQEVAPADLRMAWWGGEPRAVATRAALDLISAKYPGVTFTTEWSGFAGYFDKFATQVAGGNAPDIIQMNFAPELADYGSRGVLLDLGPYVASGKLDVSGFNEAALASGSVDGVLYALPLSGTTPATIINQTKFGALGLAEPPADWTWEDFAALAAEIPKAANGAYVGADDASARQEVYEVWYLGRTGTQLYNDAGERTDTVDDLAAWFQMWADMRAAGSIVQPDVQAAHTPGDNATMPFVLGRSAMTFQWSQGQTTLASLQPDDLGLALQPSAGEHPHQYVRPGNLISVTARSRNVDTAVAAVSAFVSDPEVLKVLGMTRGVPSSSQARALLEPTLTPIDQEQVAFIDKVSSGALTAAPSASFRGMLDVDQLFTRTGQDIAFGRVSIAEGAQRFLDQAADLLAR